MPNRIIPADHTEPIRSGVAMMAPIPSRFELDRVLAPHFDGHTFCRIQVEQDGVLSNLFIGTVATGQPIDERATEIYFASGRGDWQPAELSPIAGPTVIFNEPVCFFPETK
jgi:hypothetical protein